MRQLRPFDSISIYCRRSIEDGALDKLRNEHEDILYKHIPKRTDKIGNILRSILKSSGREFLIIRVDLIVTDVLLDGVLIDEAYLLSIVVNKI